MMQSKSYSAQSICVEEKSFRKDGRWEFEDGSFYYSGKKLLCQTFFFPLPASILPAFTPSSAPPPEFDFPDARLAKFFEW